MASYLLMKRKKEKWWELFSWDPMCQLKVERKYKFQRIRDMLYYAILSFRCWSMNKHGWWINKSFAMIEFNIPIIIKLNNSWMQN